MYRSDDPSHVYRSTNISAENASSATIWGYQFDNLPQYDQNAVPFEYSVKEHSAPKYYESSVVGMDITNTYHPEPVDFNFALKKLILARRIGLDTFHFVMQGVDGAPMPNGAINGEIRLSGINGVHNFGDVTYSHVGQYVYRFYEEAGTNQKFTYDTSILTMIVNVTDVDGKLQTGYRVTREKDGQVIDEGGKLEIKKIEDVSTSLASLIERVSESTRKVSTMAENIASDMSQINQMAVTTTENVIKTSDSIENLSVLSQELKNSVSGFKLPVGY